MFVVARSEMGQLIVRARELRGDRTLTDVARVVGIRQDELGKIERGETTSIRFDTLLRLCAAYRVDVGELLSVQQSPAPPAGLLGAVLAGLADGSLATDQPARARSAAQDADLFMEPSEAAAALAGREEPVPARGRRRVPEQAST